MPDPVYVEIDALEHENKALKHDIGRHLDITSELATENAALAKRVEVLEKALRPFAKLAERVDLGCEASVAYWNAFHVRVRNGDLLEARAALEDK